MCTRVSMRTPGVKVTLNERVALIRAPCIESFEDAKGRDGLPRKGIIGHGHLDAVACRARDPGVDGAFIHGDVSMHERDVAPIERARADEVLQLALRIVILGGKHEARGVTVQAVDDARTVLTLDGTEVVEAAMVGQGVGERSVHVPMGRMAHEPALESTMR